MDYRKIGRTELETSTLILGSMAVGTNGYFGTISDKEFFSVVNASIDSGVNHIDTAELYESGLSEKLIGKAIKGKRNNVLLSTKVWTTHFKYLDAIKACENSLERLETDYVDFLYMHDYPGDLLLAETFEAFDLLKEQGKIRHIAVSNFSLEQLIKVSKLGRVELIQPCYSLAWRYIEKDILPYCVQQDISVAPYSPLAQGLLAGKYTSETTFLDGRTRPILFQKNNFPRVLEMVEKLRPLADSNGITLAQLSLNWVMNAPGITAAIAGARNAEQAMNNAAAANVHISASDYQRISAISHDFTSSLPQYRSFFSDEVIS